MGLGRELAGNWTLVESEAAPAHMGSAPPPDGSLVRLSHRFELYGFNTMMRLASGCALLRTKYTPRGTFAP